MSRNAFLAAAAFWVVMILVARSDAGVWLAMIFALGLGVIGGTVGRGISVENLVFDAVFLFSAACLIAAGLGIGQLRKGDPESGYSLLTVAVSLVGFPLVVYLSLDKMFAHWP